MLPRKIFENLDAVMAILVFFEQLLWQTLFDFFAPNSASFNKYDAFFSHIFYLCYKLSKDDHCYSRGSKL